MIDFSYQLYSSREFPPLADTLKLLKSLGYGQVEGYGGVYSDLPALKAALDETGLKMTTGHFGLDMIEGEPEKVLEIANTVGMEAVFCPFLMPDQRPEDAAGYARFGERLQKAGERLKQGGLSFGWHNTISSFARCPTAPSRRRRFSAAGPSFPGKQILPGSCAAAVIRLNGSRNTGSASSPSM